MWAKRIETLNLSSIVLFLIPIIRPFSYLGSQALVMVRPLTRDITGDVTFGRIQTLLDNPKMLEQLETCLEGKEANL
jgi:hypothetical protein